MNIINWFKRTELKEEVRLTRIKLKKAEGHIESTKHELMRALSSKDRAEQYLAEYKTEVDDQDRIIALKIVDLQDKLRIARLTNKALHAGENFKRRAELRFVINRIKQFVDGCIDKDVHPNTFWKWLLQMQGLVTAIDKSYDEGK